MVYRPTSHSVGRNTVSYLQPLKSAGFKNVKVCQCYSSLHIVILLSDTCSGSTATLCLKALNTLSEVVSLLIKDIINPSL